MTLEVNKLGEKLQRITNILKKNKYINVISDGLIALFPILMIGAFFTIFNGLAWEPWVQFMEKSGIKQVVSLPVQLTTNMIAVYATFSIAYKLAESFDKDGFSAGFIAMISFLIVTPLTTFEDGTIALTFSWTGAGGLFVSFVIALFITRIYVLLIDKDLVIKMPKGVPPTTTKAFAGLIPMIVIVFIDLAIYFGFKATSFESIHGFVYNLLQIPLSNLGNTLLVFLFLKILTNILWMFGIHGGLVMYSIAVPLWLSMDYANIEAYAAGGSLPYILGYAFGMLYFQFSGTGNTIGLNLLMLKAKSKRYRTLGKLALPAGICGVNEPIIFGTPIIMNPMLVIPFIGCPLISGLLAYILTIIGILPRLNGVFMFGIPFGLSGFLAGGWRVALFQLVILVPLSYFCYLPFFKKMDTIAYAEEQQEVEKNAIA